VFVQHEFGYEEEAQKVNLFLGALEEQEVLLTFELKEQASDIKCTHMVLKIHWKEEEQQVLSSSQSYLHAFTS